MDIPQAVTGTIAFTEEDDTMEAFGVVRYPDDGSLIVTSRSVPLGNEAHMLWLTDGAGNDLYGSGIGAPDDED